MTRRGRAALLLFALPALALAACDAPESTTLRVLGVATPPDWDAYDCHPESDAQIFSVPSSRYWTCGEGPRGIRFRVEWWRGAAVAGQRRWWQSDSLAWERAQDSTAAALTARATPRPCTRAVPEEERYVVGAIVRARVWTLAEERRSVVMRSRWIPGHEARYRGMILVSTDTGEVDPCRRVSDADFW